MFDVILDYIKRLFKSRLFPITLIYLVLFIVIINRLFTIQIVQGPANASNSGTKFIKTRELKSARGNIYDRNGKILATNSLSYSITLEDKVKVETNNQRNNIIHQLINIIELNGDTLDTEFFIRQNSNGKLEFTTDDNDVITRFKKSAYALTFEKKPVLSEEQKNATAEQVYDFLKNGTKTIPMFGISDKYSIKDTLKIMSVRFALFCNYPKYNQIVVASNVSEATVAAVKEDNADLLGVEVQKQTKRFYNDSIYFAHILGYTGKINAQELKDYNKDSKNYYNSTDIIGKTGLERQYEKYLTGKKGSENVAVSNLTNKVINVVDHVAPVAGNDIYLTIDSDLQKAAYTILEKQIAGILISKIKPDMNYGGKGKNAGKIAIPIYEVYNALINNSVIDINHFTASDATSLEQRVYGKYTSRMHTVFNSIDNYLSVNSTVPNDKAGDMESYLDYIYQVMAKNKILLTASIPADDATYKSYQNKNISLSKFLRYAIENNWIDLTKLNIGNKYYNSEELYTKLINYTKDILKEDNTFKKKIYRDLIFSYNLSGNEICLLLFDQGVLKYKEEDVNSLKYGSISAYSFIMKKLYSLEITPGMLALEPCSGSIVVTDIHNGNVLALVTYPSFDNNKLANKMDVNYYNKIHEDKAYSWMNRPVSQLIAPGSTFKITSAITALEEGVVTPSQIIYDKGEFKKIKPSPKCDIFPRSHGDLTVSDAIKVSCNYFFYTLGWQLSLDNSGNFHEELGLEKLKKYASLFGLNNTSGIELYEAKPHLSTNDSVRSTIGQGSTVVTAAQLSKYVTALANNGTSYNLTLLDKIVKNGKTILQNKPVISNKITDFKASTWDAVHKGMYDVANTPGGTVHDVLNKLGVTVAGKTGTSQVSKNHPSNSLFISYAPYDKPVISVTTIIPNGYTSTYAAEVAGDIYKYYFKLESDKKLLNSKVKIPYAGSLID